SLQHHASPLRLFAGDDCLRHLPRELDRLGAKRAVIVCGPSLARSGLLGAIEDALGGRAAGRFSLVRPHSPLPDVMAAADTLRASRADVVIAVGGGSAIVTARAATILLAEGKPIAELATSWKPGGELHSPRLLADKLPQIVLPTTPTTAMVKAGSAVHDPAQAARLALFDPKTRAQALFLHPGLLASAPPGLIVSAGLDTLSLAVEGLLARGGDPLADANLIHAVRLVTRHLRGDPADDDTRAQLVFAAILAGQGTDFTGAGIATVLGHAIGMGHAIDNGIAKAILLPHAVRFNAAAAPAGIAKVAIGLGLDAGSTPNAVASALAGVGAALGAAARLRDAGISHHALADIAARGMDDWFLRGNPRPVESAADLQSVLEAAW
ncbi:MAG: iron-containing alcohol dehydrogenase, partial [Rhodospirillales bacterium]|nr:iron-containing alcohol dehydrogenase [Rhodospirillales bacterium]